MRCGSIYHNTRIDCVGVSERLGVRVDECGLTAGGRVRFQIWTSARAGAVFTATSAAPTLCVGTPWARTSVTACQVSDGDGRGDGVTNHARGRGPTDGENER